MTRGWLPKIIRVHHSTGAAVSAGSHCLGAEAALAIDRWDGSIYQRVSSLGVGAIEVSVRQIGSCVEPRLLVQTTPALLNPSDRHNVKAVLHRLLGFGVDLTGVSIGGASRALTPGRGTIPWRSTTSVSYVL